jgi:HlyD family secretion protein
MNQRKLPITVVGILITAALVAACSAPGTTGTNQTGGSQAASGTRVTVKTGSVENHIVATGKIVARATALLAFPRTGTVKTVLVNVGDSVKAGQVLASQDTTNLDLSAQQSLASYLDAQATYSTTIKGPTDSDLQAAQAGVINAQEAYSTSLKGATPADLGSAYAAVQSAQAALAQLTVPPTQYDVGAANATLQNAEADLKVKQAAYDSANRRNPAAIGADPASLALEQSTNNYNAAKAAYDKLFQPPTASAVQSAKAQVASASASVANLQPTKEKIAAAYQTLQTAISKLNTLTPTVETIQSAKAKMDSAYVGWQVAQKAVSDATLLAPYDGMVAAVNIAVGDSSSSGTGAGSGSAIEIADFATPEFEINVDETDMGGVKLGQDAIIQLQSYPSLAIPGKVERIDASGIAASGGIVSFNVYLGVGKVATTTAGNAQPAILLGMSGTSQVVTAKADNVVVVPNAALTVDPTTRAYSVRKVGPGGTVQTVNVTVGFKGTDSVEVTEGVSAGDVLLIPRATGSTGGAGAGGGGGQGGPPGGG